MGMIGNTVPAYTMFTIRLLLGKKNALSFALLYVSELVTVGFRMCLFLHD